jgi:hypothetical protein
MVAPVYLPLGSIIESFTVYVLDSSTTYNLVVYFDRTGSWGGWDWLGTVASTGSNSSVQAVTDPSILPAAKGVQLDQNYHLDFCFPPSTALRLYGAKVNYSLPTSSVYLPLVIKSPAPVIPTTDLSVENDTGGVILYYRIYESAGGALLTQCPTNISNGNTVPCGSFASGTRYVVTKGNGPDCGSEEVAGNVSFPEGTCTRTVRCGRDNPTTMVCN